MSCMLATHQWIDWPALITFINTTLRNLPDDHDGCGASAITDRTADLAIRAMRLAERLGCRFPDGVCTTPAGTIATEWILGCKVIDWRDDIYCEWEMWDAWDDEVRVMIRCGEHFEHRVLDLNEMEMIAT